MIIKNIIQSNTHMHHFKLRKLSNMAKFFNLKIGIYQTHISKNSVKLNKTRMIIIITLHNYIKFEAV